MEHLGEWITIFRSAETDAESEAARIADRLHAAGIDSRQAGDDTPGVVTGTWEVRVAPENAARAESVIAGFSPDTAPQGDASHALDLVTIFSSQNVDAESEALAMQSVLEANGIPALLSGTPQIPSFPFKVQVPKDRIADAERVLAEARAAGPAAAEEAEAQSEIP